MKRLKQDKMHRAYRTKRRKKDWFTYLWQYDDKFVKLNPNE